MRAYFSGTANLQAFGSKRFHFTIELKISYSVRFGLDLLISFGSTVQNWNCDNLKRRGAIPLKAMIYHIVRVAREPGSPRPFQAFSRASGWQYIQEQEGAVQEIHHASSATH